MVYKGYAQEEHVDYGETFTPIERIEEVSVIIFRITERLGRGGGESVTYAILIFFFNKIYASN